MYNRNCAEAQAGHHFSAKLVTNDNHCLELNHISTMGYELWKNSKLKHSILKLCRIFSRSSRFLENEVYHAAAVKKRSLTGYPG